MSILYGTQTQEQPYRKRDKHDAQVRCQVERQYRGEEDDILRHASRAGVWPHFPEIMERPACQAECEDNRQKGNRGKNHNGHDKLFAPGVANHTPVEEEHIKLEHPNDDEVL